MEIQWNFVNFYFELFRRLEQRVGSQSKCPFTVWPNYSGCTEYSQHSAQEQYL